MIMHKRLHASALKDNCGPNKRTAICGLIVDMLDGAHLWKDVTCKDCLKGKPERRDK